jgi:hypothetical protein
MPQCRQMRTCAKSCPPSCGPKNQKTPPASGIFSKSSFCERTQAASDQKNTSTFPGFLRLLTPRSRVLATYRVTSQHQHAHTPPEIQTHPPGQPGKNIKTRNELNPTRRTPGLADRQRTQSVYPFLSALVRGPKSLIRYSGSPTCARCRGNHAWQSTVPAPLTGINS